MCANGVIWTTKLKLKLNNKILTMIGISKYFLKIIKYPADKKCQQI